MHDAYVITGQTASGKTSYALKLAKNIGGELISVDSRQIYQKLDVITGKDIPSDTSFVTVEESLPLDENRIAKIGYYLFDGVKVWGLDLVDISTTFSAHDFRKVCEFILAKCETPIFVGGTYFYLKSVLFGFDISVSPNWSLRKKLKHTSIKELQALMKHLDQESFEKLNHSDLHNPHRLMRRIEIAQSESKRIDQKPLVKVVEMKGLRFSSSEKLKEVIAKRVHERLNQGAVEEVKKLLSSGYTKNDPGLRTIGYQEIITYVDGETSLKEAIELWIRAEVRYAKRQMTFMKSNADIQWIEV